MNEARCSRPAMAVALAIFAVASLPAATRGDAASAARLDRWVPLRPATLEREEVAAARIGRFIYVVGGYERQGFERHGELTTAALERYDTRRNRWRRLRPMPVALNHAVAVSYRGRLYVHGGFPAGQGTVQTIGAQAGLYRYEPGSDSWSRLPASPTPRGSHAGAVVGQRLYVAGGANAGGSLRSLEVYDFSRRRWSRGPNFPGPARNHAAGVASGGRFYVLGGRVGDSIVEPTPVVNYGAVDRYDPRRNRWQRLPSMRRARSGFAAAPLPDGRIAVFGGEDWPNKGPDARPITAAELFDPVRRLWRPLPDMRTPRHALGGAALGNRVYALMGGRQPGLDFSNVVEALDIPAR